MKKSGMKEIRKRLLALGLAVVLVGSSVNLSVSASEQAETADPVTVETIPEEQPEEVSEEVAVESETPVVEETETPSEETPSGEPKTEAPAEEPEAPVDEPEVPTTEEPAENPEDSAEEQPAEDTEAPAEEEVSEEPEAPAEEQPAEEPEVPAEETVSEETSETLETSADEAEVVVEEQTEALPETYLLEGGQEIETLSEDENENEINIEKIEKNGQIVIDKNNLDDWDHKTLTGNTTTNSILIDGDITLNLTIKDLTIYRKETTSNSLSAIALTDTAKLNLTLEGDSKLYGAYGGAGIGVPNGTTLCITEESTGSLYAKGGNAYGGAAGIGAISPGWNMNYSSSNPQTRTCGYIEIAGGDVTAVGGTYKFRESEICGAAGIGGSYGASGGIINITGGTVHAIGGLYGAGIGGGSNGSVARITIEGGNVTAEGTGKGSRQPAAIGRGVDSFSNWNDVLPCGAIEIKGGKVTAKGNIGYGYVDCGEYPISGPNAKVTVSDDAYLTLDGEIRDGSSSNTTKNYELHFTVFDVNFESDQTAKVELDSSLIQDNVTAKVETPGRAEFALSFTHNVFDSEKTFTVTIGGKTYEAKVTFTSGQTEYNLTAGQELYPVSLEFYDSAITGDVAVESITVKQNGTALDGSDYSHPNTITKLAEGIGKMMIFLPADNGTTEITVQAEGINSSAEMTKRGLSVSEDGITNVIMCSTMITLSAEVKEKNITDVTLSVESNVVNWELYIKQSNEEITNANEIILDNKKYEQTDQKGEVTISNLRWNTSYRYYIVAKKDQLISNIICVEFTTPYGAKVIWEDGTTENKDRFLDAVYNADKINPEGFTIQALSGESWGTTIILKNSCTLDFNGKTFTINSMYYSLAFAEGVSAVLMDSTGSAEYHNANGNSAYSFFNMASNSSLTILGGSYYDYKELLKTQNGETQTGRTLTIEGGSFYGGNHIDIGDGKVILSGGTFYGGLSVSGNYEIKDGYCVKYLTGNNKGTYTTSLPARGDDIEIVPLPALTGDLDLKIGNGISSSARVETTLTATFTDKSGSGTYIYTWYSVDGDTTTKKTSSTETYSKQSTYMLGQEDIGKQIYCEVTKKGTSGSVKSEMTYPILGYSIESAAITLKPGAWEYDGTEKKPDIALVKLSGGTTLTNGVGYQVSYADNVNAGTGRVIITGIGIYDGTAETTFAINKKQVTNLTFDGMEKEYEYTGEEIRPEFTLKDSDTDKVIPESEYTVEYINNTTPMEGYFPAVRVTPKADGNYNFSAVTTGTREFKIVHEHNWRYKESGSAIILECQKPVCTCSASKKATIQIYIDNYNKITYTGSQQDVAVIWQNPFGIYPNDKITKTYIGDGLENGLPKNAGSYTVSLTINEDGVSYTASDKFKIEKATPDIGTVTANELENTLDIDQVKLSRENETVPGTLKLKEGTKLQWGTYDYDWIFTPDDSMNYNSVEETVSITVKDTVPPTAEWQIGTSGWREFINKITLGYLCKNTETMEIQFSDNLSGVKEKQYYIADSEIKDFSNVEWINYTLPIVLPLGPQKFVYVRVTDNAGNKAILNSDGIVVYRECSLPRGNEILYSYKEGREKVIAIKENGNIFSKVVDENGQELENDSYDYNGELLTMNPKFLDSLSVGTHKYKIVMYPQGQQGYQTIAYQFQIKVEKAKLKVSGVRTSDRVYDGSNLVDITEVILENTNSTNYYNVSVDATNLKGTLESANAGIYKKLRLPELTLTGSEADSYELIQPTDDVLVFGVGVTISKKAAPVIAEQYKSYVYAKETEESIDLAALLPTDCGEIIYEKPNNGNRGFIYYKTRPTIEGNILSYTTAKTTWEQLVGDKPGELVVPVQMTNYEDIEIRFQLSLRDQTNVILKEGTQIVLENNVMTFGETLAKLPLGDAVFTDEAGNEIEGTFGWADETWMPYAGDSQVAWRFRPVDAEYKTVYGNLDIVVNKAVPVVESPVSVKERTWHPAKALTDADLSEVAVLGVDGNAIEGTWSWKQADIVPEVNNDGYEAVFTPDSQNYEAITATIAVPVKKAVPVVTEQPAASEISEGGKLEDSVLNGGKAQYEGLDDVVVKGSFSWKDSAVKPNAADSGQTAYTVIFTPDDAEHYEAVELTVTLTVKPVDKTPDQPAEDPKQPAEDTKSSGESKKGSKGSSSKKTSAETPAAAAPETPGSDGNISEVRLPSAPAPESSIVQPTEMADAKQPYLGGDAGKSGWDVIREQLSESNDQKNVTVVMNGATIVPGDVLESIQGQDISIAFEMDNGMTWTVNGMDISVDQIGDIDFGVTSGEEAGKKIPVDIINQVTGERYSMNLSLSYDGEFGFKAVLTVNVEKENAGLYANLFYYNAENGELEFMCAGEIGTDGNVNLPFEHASDYVIVIDTAVMDGSQAEQPEEENAEPEEAADEETPAQEGSSGAGVPVMLVIVLILICAGAAFVLAGKRKKSNREE